MAEYYEISMETPLGKYNGIVKLEKSDNGKVDGILEILDYPSSFTGLYDKDGNISFSGELNTSVVTSHYSFRGEIINGELEGVMDTKNGLFKIKPSKKKPNKDKLTEFGSTFTSSEIVNEEIDVDGANNS